MQNPTYYLNKYYNHKTFLKPQEEIIKSVLNKQDTIALLPTGGGKSICFQIPTLMTSGICLVITPLIALMQDQVSNLKQKNIKAVYLQAKLYKEDIVRIFDNCQFGNIKFLYLSPERLQSDFIIQKLKQLNISLVAIDEAHCISEWGHDFRPAYLKIAKIKNALPNIPFLALTATATAKVIQDIEKYLELKQPRLFKKSFYRENIAYQIIETEDKNTQLINILKKNNKPAIVYTNTRKLTKLLANLLHKHNLKSSYYHGGLNQLEKDIAYKNWMTEKTSIMVATNAFGLGIDKENVNIVIHYNLPNSIENFVQESGRAGRNNYAAKAILFKSQADIKYLKNQFVNNTPKVNFIYNVYQKLNQYYNIAYGSLSDKWFDFEIVKFCDSYNLDLILTHNSIKTLARQNILNLTSNFYNKTKIFFIASNKQVLNYCDSHNELGKLIKVILRTYGGLFDHKSSIDINLIASKLGITKNKVHRNLQLLERDKIIEYKAVNNNIQLQFLVPREDKLTFNKISKSIKSYQKHQLDKLKAIIEYVNNNKVCRAKFLLKYFGENMAKNCGNCDICNTKTTKAKPNYNKLAKQIISLLTNNLSLSSKTIFEKLNADEKHVLLTLQLLLDNDKIIVNSQHKFQLKK